jgi:phosphohistidine phosphatase
LKLYFLRHGLADRSAWSGSDFLRPLTPAGRRQLERSAETLVRLELGLDGILTSPLTRARQTAEIVAARLDLDELLVEDPRLGHDFGPRDLAEIVDEHAGAHALLLVGHEPGFSGVVSAITGGSDILFKKGGLARVDLDDHGEPAGTLVWLLTPKVLSP